MQLIDYIARYKFSWFLELFAVLEKPFDQIYGKAFWDRGAETILK